MATYKDLCLQGVADDLQIGRRGARLIHDPATGDVQFFEADGTTLTNIDLLDPTDPTHAATKAYVDSVAAGLVPLCREVVIGTGALQAIGAVLPAGVSVEEVILEITTPYSVGTTITIEDDAGVPQALMGPLENDAEEATVWRCPVPPSFVLGGTSQINAAVAGAPAAGAGIVRVTYRLCA